MKISDLRGCILIFMCLVFNQLYNEGVHQTPRPAQDSTWPMAQIRITASPIYLASSLCCCVLSPIPRLVTGPSACRETTWWASRTYVSWQPGCCSVLLSGPRTSLSSPIYSSWIRWVGHFSDLLDPKSVLCYSRPSLFFLFYVVNHHLVAYKKKSLVLLFTKGRNNHSWHSIWMVLTSILHM